MAEWLMAVVLKTVAAPFEIFDFLKKCQFFCEFGPQTCWPP